MSWYKDPGLFISCWYPTKDEYHISRITKKYNVPLLEREDVKLVAILNFSEHLSLGYNNHNAYDAIKSNLAEYSVEVSFQNVKFVNCQGLVVYWDYLNHVGTWSRVEEHDSVFYSLPGITNPSDTVLGEKLQAVEKRISELVAEISGLKETMNNQVTNLQEQLNQEKNDKKALQTQVVDLTTKLEECCCNHGSVGGI